MQENSVAGRVQVDPGPERTGRPPAQSGAAPPADIPEQVGEDRAETNIVLGYN